MFRCVYPNLGVCILINFNPPTSPLLANMYHHSHSISEPTTCTISDREESELVKMFKLMNSLTGKTVDLKDLRNRFLSNGLNIEETDLESIMKVCG